METYTIDTRYKKKPEQYACILYTVQCTLCTLCRGLCTAVINVYGSVKDLDPVLGRARDPDPDPRAIKSGPNHRNVQLFGYFTS